jgi:hypothetical protein
MDPRVFRMNRAAAVLVTAVVVLLGAAALLPTARADSTLAPAFQEVLRGFQSDGTFPDDLTVADHFQTINYTEESRSPLDTYTAIPTGPGISGPPTSWVQQMDSPFCNPMYSCVSDSNWATYIFNSLTPSNPVIFGMTDFAITAGWTDIDVTEKISCAASAAGTGAKISHYVDVDGIVSQGSNAGDYQCPDGAATNYTTTLETQPDGSEWSNFATDHMQCGVKSGDDVGPYPKVYEISCLVEVSYLSGYVLELYYSWDLTNSASAQLCVWGWSNQSGEDFYVGIWNGATYTTRITITGPSDPEACSTYTLLSSEVPQGDVIIRLTGEDDTPSDTTNTTLLLDRVTLTLTSAAVTTNPAVILREDTARLNGNLGSKGSAATITVFFVWGESAGSLGNATPQQNRTTTGAFTASLAGLQVGQTYYFRAVAIGLDNATGVILSFTMTLGGSFVVQGLNIFWIGIFGFCMVLMVVGAWKLHKRFEE